MKTQGLGLVGPRMSTYTLWPMADRRLVVATLLHLLTYDLGSGTGVATQLCVPPKLTVTMGLMLDHLPLTHLGHLGTKSRLTLMVTVGDLV